MGKLVNQLLEQHIEFIAQQHMFFVATAPLDESGHINISPKGLSHLKVLSPHRVAYMDFVGSGNETSAHLMENSRITFMFCSFQKVPNILRLYGNGKTFLAGDAEWKEYARHFTIYPSTRQIIVADIYHVQNSCGYGVPLYEYLGTRSTLFDWADKKNEEEMLQYQHEKNLYSIDGLPSKLSERFRP